MWFFLIKSIVGAVLGQATNAWFKKTAMGGWFYGKVEQCYNWAAKRYNIKVLNAEQKAMEKFPTLTKKINKLEEQVAKLQKKQEKLMFFTIGIILGFMLGWYVNEKFEDIAAGIKLLKFWK